MLSERNYSQLEKDVEEVAMKKEQELQQLLRNNDMTNGQNEGEFTRAQSRNYLDTRILNSCFSNTDRIHELNRQIESMSDELISQEVEANSAIEQCEERFAASEQENALLRDNLEEAKTNDTELRDLRNSLSNDDQIVLQWEERTNTLSESVAALEHQLEEQEQEACDAIEQWQTTCSDLETKCATLEVDIKNSRETISTRVWSIEQLRSCNESYCVQIKKLKTASLIVESSVKADLVSATSEIPRLVEVLEAERKNRVDERVQLQAELKAEKERNIEARDEIETLSSSLKEIKIESEDTLNQWTGTYLYVLFSAFFDNSVTFINNFPLLLNPEQGDTQNWKLILEKCSSN